MNKRDLKKLSKNQLIKLLLKQEKKKPKVVIVDNTKLTRPNRPNRPPPPIPEGVKPFRPKQTVKLRRKHKVVVDRPGWVRNPNTNRWIKIDGPTYRKLYPIKYVLNEINKINKRHQEINETSKSIDDKYIKVSTPVQIKLLDKALSGYTKSYEITIINNKDPLKQLQNTRGDLAYHIKKMIKSMKGLKYVETLKITFEKFSGKEITYKTAYFNASAYIIMNNIDIKGSLKFSMEYILSKIASWIYEGSGWTIQSVDNHYMNIVKYQPIRGSSYIQLPEELRNSAKSLINLKNRDDECFRWCHVRHLNPQGKDPQKIKKSDKEYINKLDYSGIEFPVTIKQINKIEKKNSIRINVFGYEEKLTYPIYISDEKYEDHMELLLITKDENKHYILIKDFNKFMYQQTKHKERKHFCMHCLQCFSSERVLNNHKNNCIQINGTQAINMPKKGDNILKFNNYHKQLPVPFVIYADFEAITKKVQGCKQSEEMENEKNKRSYTEAYQTHKTAVVDTS